MSKIKLNIVTIAKEYRLLSQRFEGANSEYSKFQDELVLSYIPSAINHYLENGTIGALNRVRGVAVRTKAVSVFGRLVDSLACHTLNKETGKFQGAMTQKQKDKRKELRKINEKTGNPVWVDRYLAKLEQLNKRNEKGAKQSWDDGLLSAVRKLKSLHESAETDEQRGLLAPMFDNVLALVDSLEEKKKLAKQNKLAA